MNPRPSRPVVSASPVPLRDHCNGVPVAVSEMVDGICNTVVLGDPEKCRQWHFSSRESEKRGLHFPSFSITCRD
jgi:hypothetical protein